MYQFLYQFFKRNKKPINTGVIVSNGMTTQYAAENYQDAVYSLGHILGIIFSPLLFVIPNVLLAKLLPNKKKLLEHTTPSGFIWGGYLGNLASHLIVGNLPFFLDSAAGIVIGVVTMTAAAMALPFIQKKLNKDDLTNLSSEENEALVENIYDRFSIGLRMGGLLGLSFGASFEFLHPGIGLMAAAISAVTVAPLMAIAGTFMPSLLKKCDPSKASMDAEKLSNFKNSINIGAILGYLIGSAVGTVFLPVVGTWLGGMIGAGIGGVTCGGLNKAQTAISQRLNPTDNSVRPEENYWISNILFGIKMGAIYGGALGGTFGTFFCPGIGNVIGAIAGALLGCAIGAAIAVAPHILKTSAPPILRPETIVPDCPDTSTPFAKKARLAVSLGAGLGGLVGGAFGTFFCPVVGTFVGSMFGAALGATIGLGIAAILTMVDSCRKPTAKPADETVKPKASIDMDNSTNTAQLKNQLSNNNDNTATISQTSTVTSKIEQAPKPANTAKPYSFWSKKEEKPNENQYNQCVIM